MSDHIRYAIHIRRLLQIKERPNQYPVYNVEKAKSLKKLKMDKILSEIKENKRNIKTVKRSFEKERPVNYDDDRYIYDREVQNLQKELLNHLIKHNRNLNNQLNTIKYGRDNKIFKTSL